MSRERQLERFDQEIEEDEEIAAAGKRIKREIIIELHNSNNNHQKINNNNNNNNNMGRRHMVGPPGGSSSCLNTITPCAACKLLRRRCAEECPFSPYFSPHEPHKFAAVHKVFGASNVSKMLLEVPESQRVDAANSLVYEANVRLRDPVYGCMGAISALQQQVQALQAELNAVRTEILKFKFREAANTLDLISPTNTTTTTTTTSLPPPPNTNTTAPPPPSHVAAVAVALPPQLQPQQQQPPPPPATPPPTASSPPALYTPPPPPPPHHSVTPTLQAAHGFPSISNHHNLQYFD